MFKRLTLILFIVLMATIQLTFTACDNAQSRAEKIISLRSERKQIIDTLYQEYGGSELSHAIKSSMQNENGSGGGPEDQIIHGLANIAQGADRTIFEQSIRSVGNGENLIMITDKAEQFFLRRDVVVKAQRICEIDIVLAQLEIKEN